jgi:type IV pilus assembly protein PilM
MRAVHGAATGEENAVGILDIVLGRSKPPMLGLDIGLSSLKLVELSCDKAGVYTLEHYATEPLEKGWVVDGQIEKFDEVAEAVRRVVIKSGSKARDVAIAMPQSLVITRRISLPGGLRELELEAQVMAEANQYIPFALDEVALDFCVIGPSAASPSDVEVMIAASRKDRVGDRQGLAEAAGLNAVVIDIESLAVRLAMSRIVDALPEANKDTLVALFEVGADNASLRVMRNDEILFDRDQPFGGAQLTQMIARQYGFAFDEAERKKVSGQLPEDYESTVLPQFLEMVVQDCGKALQYFFSSTPHHRVHYIMLSGGTASLPGLAERVQSLTQSPTQVVNPFENMRYGAGVKESKLRREASSYLTACGLAMRRFTL